MRVKPQTTKRVCMIKKHNLYATQYLFEWVKGICYHAYFKQKSVDIIQECILYRGRWVARCRCCDTVCISLHLNVFAEQMNKFKRCIDMWSAALSFSPIVCVIYTAQEQSTDQPTECCTHTDTNKHVKGAKIIEMICNSLSTCTACIERMILRDADETTRYTREYVD